MLTETELDIGDKPNVPGYITLLPSVLESNVVRSVTLIKRSLRPQRLDSPWTFLLWLPKWAKQRS